MRLALALLFALALSARAATYYVATTGNDGNPGTQTQPWRTIQKSANTMIAGDTVLVQPGSYGESVTTGAAGAAGNYITFRGVSSPTTGAFAIAHAYNRVEGFTLNSFIPVLTPAASILLLSTGHFAQVVSNIVQNPPAGVRGLNSQWSATHATNCWIEGNRFLHTLDHSMGLDGRNGVVTNNFWENTNGMDAIICTASDTIFTHNTFTNVSNYGSPNHTDIIQTDHFGNMSEVSTNVVFECNFVINCTNTQIGNLSAGPVTAIGWWTFRNNVYVNLTGACNIGLHDCYWYNNTFYRCTQNTGSPLRFVDGPGEAGFGVANNGKVFNNIFVECGSNTGPDGYGWYGFEGGVINCTANYNMVAGANWVAKTAFTTEANGINGGNPLFANLANYDFHLQAGSPARDSGTTLSGFNYDHDGVARPQGAAWDIGAYEFPGGVSVTGSTAFGSVDVVGGTSTNTFTITNGSGAQITVDPVTLSGGDSAMWTVHTQPGSPVANGTNTTFTLVFNPASVGAKTATATVTHSGPGSPVALALTGTGIAPDIDVTGNAAFGNAKFGVQTVDRIFTVANITYAYQDTLNLSGSPLVVIGGTNPGDFSVTVVPTTPIAPDTNTTFTVRFTPGAVGSRSATATLTTDDPDEPTVVLNLTGTGTEPEIEVRGNSIEIVNGDATPSTGDFTDFGSAQVTGVTITRLFRVHNTGLAELLLTGTPKVALSGTHAADFTVTVQPNSPVGAANYSDLQIRGDPSATGVRSATVSVANDDATENPYTFAIQIAGTADPSGTVEVVTITGNVTVTGSVTLSGP